MTTGYFGWDLLYSSVETDIKTDQDILVCLAHLILVSNGFKCVGLGKSELTDGYQRREVLPKGWNESYALKYEFRGHLYNFAATSLDTGVMLNLETEDKTALSLVQLKSSSVVKSTGLLEEMVPDYLVIVDVIKKELIEKVVDFRRFKEVSVQTRDPEKESNLLDIFKETSLDSLRDIKVLFKERSSHLTV